MKRKVISALILLIFIVPGFTQEKDKKNNTEGDKKTEEKSKTPTTAGDKHYFEKILEDFETTKFEKKHLEYRVTRNQEGVISIRDQYPAPSGKSKKYLGVKVKAKIGDFFVIKPPKKLIIDKYCKSIGVWVYGKRFSGQLSIILQDATQKNHRLVLGNVNFLGWRKLIVKLSDKVKQEDEYLNKKKFLRIMQIQYRPGNMTIHPRWQYFYIDDITVMVRDKYTDRQSDDW